MDTFDVEDWIAQLSTALTNLTATAYLYSSWRFPGRIPITDGLSAEESKATEHENLFRFAQLAQQAREWRSVFFSASITTDAEREEVVCSVLQLHPIMSVVLVPGDPYVGLLRPLWGVTGFPLDYLAHKLAKSACLFGAEETARRLHKFLSEGKARQLVGYEVTLFPGLHVDRHIDIDDGLFLAPYEEVSAHFGPDPGLEDVTDDHPHPIFPEEYDLLLRDPSRVSALVREFRWGPAIYNPTPYSPPADIRPLYAANSMDASGLADEVEIMRGMLAIATKAHQWNWTSYIVVEPWVTDLFDVYGGRGGRSYHRYFNDWWRPNDPPDGWEELFGAMAQQRRRYSRNKKQLDQLDYAISRIAASYSRAGRFRLADKVIDIAIALEVIYEANDRGIFGKLRDRAASLLASDTAKPEDITKKMRAFYRARSAIVHGGRLVANEFDEKTEEAIRHGLDMARQTISALLERGETPDWDQFVLSSGIESGE